MKVIFDKVKYDVDFIYYLDKSSWIVTAFVEDGKEIKFTLDQNKFRDFASSFKVIVFFGTQFFKNTDDLSIYDDWTQSNLDELDEHVRKIVYNARKI